MQQNCSVPGDCHELTGSLQLDLGEVESKTSAAFGTVFHPSLLFLESQAV